MRLARMVVEDNVGANSKQELQSYAPSWVDLFTGWVDRLPGSAWAYYFGIGLALFLLPFIILWFEGVPVSGSFFPAFAYLAATISFLLALIHYFDKRASLALANLRPALAVDEAMYSNLQYRLTTLPARTSLLAGLIALSIVFVTEGIGGPYRLEALDTSPVSANLLRLLYLVCWVFFGTFIYHTIHQLRLINRIYTRHTRINLFQMKPLYAFSNLFALTAVCLTIIPLAWLAVNPTVDPGHPIVLGVVIAIQLMAMVTFVWPQLGMHGLQVAEKQRLLDNAGQRLEAIIDELHRRVDVGELDTIGELNTTIAVLETELGVVKSIPTWPWQPETVRWLATALLLPLGLWLIQYVLQRIMTL